MLRAHRDTLCFRLDTAVHSRLSPLWNQYSNVLQMAARGRSRPDDGSGDLTLGLKSSPGYRSSALVVLVVAAPPDACLIAPFGGAVEPLVHAPETIQSARIAGICVVDDA